MIDQDPSLAAAMVDLPPAPELNLFCETLPSLPRAWDSTMLGLLKECPKKFEYIILKGYSPTGFAAHLEFGIAYHKALETFDKDRFAGAGYERTEAARDRIAVIQRMLADGDKPEYIAAVVGVTRQRVQQIKDRSKEIAR